MKLRLTDPATKKPVEVTTAADYGTAPKVPRAKARCSCHLDPIYDRLTRCPQCRHWSYDATAKSCERRGCWYMG